MRPLRDIKRLVRRAEIHSTSEGNRAVLDDLLKGLAAGREDAPILPGRRAWGSIVQHLFARVSIAAALVLIVVLAVISRTPREPAPPPLHIGTLSVADMLTVGRLNAACRRGGLAEIDRQCELAAQKLQIRPERISVEQLIKEMKGT